MSAREIRLELLLGTIVRDSNGRRVGRIEDMRLASVRGQWQVTHVLLGPSRWPARLLTAARRLADPRIGRGRLALRALDLSDPQRPRTISPTGAEGRRGRTEAPTQSRRSTGSSP
jgi:sporulation protein YlmC with PRC-barrel domain